MAVSLPLAISPVSAADLLASALINHDTHPDLVILAATVAVDTRRVVILDDLRVDMARDMDVAFDADGWMLP